MVDIKESEAYRLYLKQEHNKKIINQFYNYLNNEKWNEIIELFHEDFFTPIPDFIDPEVEELKHSGLQFIRTFFTDNHKKLTELGRKRNMEYIWPPTNKNELINIMKLEAEYEKVSINVFNLVAENNIVFVTRSYRLTEVVTKTTTNQLVHDRFLLEDGKIRQTESFYDSLSILLQVGKVTYQENNQIKINNYLENLRKIGILQD